MADAPWFDPRSPDPVPEAIEAARGAGLQAGPRE
jgi:hypothetical protein